MAVTKLSSSAMVHKSNMMKVATTSLGASAMEKRAGIITSLIRSRIPVIAPYAKSIGKNLLRPIKEKGLIKGLASYVGKQYTPTKYTAALATKADNAADAFRVAKNVKNIDPVKLEKIRHASEAAKIRASRFQQGGAYKQLFGTAFGKGTGVSGDRLRAMGELGRAGLHYTGQGIGQGFAYGYPALGVYNAYNAPEGEKMKTLGGAVGDVAAFTLASPIAMGAYSNAAKNFIMSTPLFMGSSYVGTRVGESVGSKFDPKKPEPSLYRKAVNYAFDVPTEDRKNTPIYKQVLPQLARAASASSRGRMGFKTNGQVNPFDVAHHVLK